VGRFGQVGTAGRTQGLGHGKLASAGATPGLVLKMSIRSGEVNGGSHLKNL
jgi:hypothetical protein